MTTPASADPDEVEHDEYDPEEDHDESESPDVLTPDGD